MKITVIIHPISYFFEFMRHPHIELLVHVKLMQRACASEIFRYWLHAYGLSFLPSRWVGFSLLVAQYYFTLILLNGNIAVKLHVCVHAII